MGGVRVPLYQMVVPRQSGAARAAHGDIFRFRGPEADCNGGPPTEDVVTVVRTRTVLGIALAALVTIAAHPAAATDPTGSVSGLPIPRFVSLKTDRVNVRGGPTKDHDVAWVYNRNALPVEVTAEFETWRRIRDWEGAEGWVYHSLLSGRRTAVITMKSKDELAPLYDRADPTSAVAARLQAGVVAQVKKCTAGWCRVTGNGFDGWIEQQRLWGVYADEKVE